MHLLRHYSVRRPALHSPDEIHFLANLYALDSRAMRVIVRSRSAVRASIPLPGL